MTSSIPLALQAICVEGMMASSSPQFSLETQGKETIFSKSSGRKSLWKTLFDSEVRAHSFRDPIPEIRLIGHPVEQVWSCVHFYYPGIDGLESVNTQNGSLYKKEVFISKI